MNLFVSVAIKSRSGATVKEFSYSSADLLEDAFLWIWRDMLLKILAAGRKSDVEAIPRVLHDIQSATKQWETVLDRLLLAGRKNGERYTSSSAIMANLPSLAIPRR
jgi:hypothetical protein